MRYNEFEFNAKIWLYPGKAAWHFISIPENIYDEISTRFADLKRGWGSLQVKVTINETSWNTSIFPDKKTNTYLLPIKSDIRKKEKLEIDNVVRILLEVKV